MPARRLPARFVGEYRLGRDGEFELLHALPLGLPVEVHPFAA